MPLSPADKAKYLKIRDEAQKGLDGALSMPPLISLGEDGVKELYEACTKHYQGKLTAVDKFWLMPKFGQLGGKFGMPIRRYMDADSAKLREAGASLRPPKQGGLGAVTPDVPGTGAVTGAVSDVAGIVGALGQSATWLRVAEVALGLLLIGIAVSRLSGISASTLVGASPAGRAARAIGGQ